MSERKNVFDGAKVKSLLDENGLTAVEIAKKAGISRVQMSSYMHGRRNPKRITVQRIADALHVNISDISGYRDDDEEIAVLQFPSGTEEEFYAAVYQFVRAEVSRQVANENQSIVSKRIGLSHSQVNRIVTQKADLSLFPIGALLRLCPQLINRAILNGEPSANETLMATIEHIKRLAEQITDINTARTVENMLKGLIERR